jgi:signal transduction histidine kinase/CheY-like chemotaxis protein/purine-cytosine permease-like protein
MWSMNEAPPQAPPAQRIIKIRRDYNSWVAAETMEDYALRYTPTRFRKWSELRVANTAFGASSFLILEAVGATLLVTHGFANAFWAILATGILIFLAGLPISVYAARYGLDMDLLTRGAGFGYLGSTMTSLIYASFTFIFFALEAAVMAYALELAFDIPPVWGYLICALVVIPLVTHGVSAISKLQVWTQPLWLFLLILPFIVVLQKDPQAIAGLVHFAGEKSGSSEFTLLGFGAALTVGLALMTQMGEQVDYLRFMPQITPARKRQWWLGVIVGGPGWVVLGVLKMLGGALLASIAIRLLVPADRAVDPNQMYLVAYDMLFSTPGIAVGVTALFVIVSQLKINVTNAYAGSLAWSNFFSRLTHNHPGRVVWVVFNTLIAFMLMELNVFDALGHVLGLFSNIAISWLMAVVADLVINKPLGLSPPGIEFKRARLYDINPVGVGAMLIASILSMSAHLGGFGELAQAFSATIALITALVASPLIAWWTRGRYYLARDDDKAASALADAEATGAYLGARLQRCVICEREYEGPDMAHCPAYQGPICSLCCTLDARCDDLCKPDARFAVQWTAWLSRLTPALVRPYLQRGLAHYFFLMLVITPLLGAVTYLLHYQALRALNEAGPVNAQQLQSVSSASINLFAIQILVAAVVVWWLILARNSRQVAQEESRRQNQLLVREIDLHQVTDQKLQQAKQAADHANRAKSRYVSTLSHEFRTPLNGILGYAQLLAEDPDLPHHRKHAVAVIRRGGEHLLSLIEGTLDIARIESGKLAMNPQPMRLLEVLEDIAQMVELQAHSKGLRFVCEFKGRLPKVVRGDEKRLRQILFNLLGNAVKFTAQGRVELKVTHARELAIFEVKDTGVGMSAEELARVFEPFARSGASRDDSPGAGLGLTIARMLTELMGGSIEVDSRVGRGTSFMVKLFLPGLDSESLAPRLQQRLAMPTGWRSLNAQSQRTILAVDNEDTERELLRDWLQPLGFLVHTASSGRQALEMIEAGLRPDTILLDLAMPQLDGWQTLEQLRRSPDLQPALPIAIVSANAYELAHLDEMRFRAEDFFLKPVQRSALFAWLQSRLEVQWEYVQDSAPTVPRSDQRVPSAAELEPLRAAASIGYYRGVMQQLDQIESMNAAYGEFVVTQRGLAREFKFDVILSQLPGRMP